MFILFYVVSKSYFLPVVLFQNNKKLAFVFSTILIVFSEVYVFSPMTLFSFVTAVV